MFAYMVKHKNNRFFKSSEDVVSMFLGLVVVVAVVGFMVNFIEKRKGNIDVPGVSNDLRIEETKNLGEDMKNLENIVVQKNDSLWKIAVKVYGDGYKWTEIAKINNLKNSDLIYSGQKLILPKTEEVKTITNIDKDNLTTNERTEYVVVRGDNLWNIALKFYKDGYKWTKIWKDNKYILNSPDKLEIGMKLIIYGKI